MQIKAGKTKAYSRRDVKELFHLSRIPSSGASWLLPIVRAHSGEKAERIEIIVSHTWFNSRHEFIRRLCASTISVELRDVRECAFIESSARFGTRHGVRFVSRDFTIERPRWVCLGILRDQFRRQSWCAAGAVTVGKLKHFSSNHALPISSHQVYLSSSS